MAKNTTIFTLLQNFISQEEIAGILAEFGFEDTARKCDVPTLLNYLVGAATFEWKSLRYASDVATEKGKSLHTEGHKKKNCKCLSFAGFTRQFFCNTKEIIAEIKKTIGTRNRKLDWRFGR